MPVEINLRHLEKKNIELQGDLPAGDLDIEGFDEMTQLVEPVHYELIVERLKDSLLVQGSLSWTLDCQCVRCLKPFKKSMELSDWAADLPLAGEEQIAVENDLVDLTPFIREDILLAFPQHPLCKLECGGLPSAAPQTHGQRSGASSQSGNDSSAWAALDKLKF